MSSTEGIDRELVERAKRGMRPASHGFTRGHDKGRVLMSTPVTLEDKLRNMERRARARDSEHRVPQRGGFVRMIRHAKLRRGWRVGA